MLVSPAFAQAAAGGGDSALISLLPIVLIFVVFYFLLIRPQQKKMKAHREMVNNLKRGQRVVTSGGLIGTVAKVVDDGEVQVDIAEGVRVRVVRGMIQDVLSKTEPVRDAPKGKKKGKSQESDEEDETSAEAPANDPAPQEKSGLSRFKIFGGGPKSE